MPPNTIFISYLAYFIVMLDARILMWAFVMLGGGTYVFINGFKWFQQKRIIENTPTSKIRSLAMGPVEVFGKVLPYKNKMFKSPFSGSKCVWCKWTLEEYRNHGKSSSWVMVRQGLMSSYFMLNDGTGSVLVDSNGAKIDIPMDVVMKQGFLKKEFTPQVIKFLGEQNVYHKSLLLGFTKDLRAREYFLAPNDKVYIMGTAGDNPFVEEGLALKNEIDIMIQKGKTFYFISDKEEKDIVKKLKWKVIGGLFGGSALIIISMVIIFSYLGIL